MGLSFLAIKIPEFRMDATKMNLFKMAKHIVRDRCDAKVDNNGNVRMNAFYLFILNLINNIIKHADFFNVFWAAKIKTNLVAIFVFC